MNGKMIIKLTLNEATDPDLYTYLARFDNVRLRAGAFKAMAGAAVRGDRPHGGSQSPVPPIFAAPVETVLPTSYEASATVQKRRLAPASAPTMAGAEAVQEREISREPPPSSQTASTGRRFDTDAIGEQFADF